MDCGTLKSQLFVLLIIITNELLVDCMESDVEEPRYWQRTEEIFIRTLKLPADAHELITGNYMLLPPGTRDQIDYMFRECARKKISFNDYSTAQVMVVEAILEWKKSHTRRMLDESMDQAMQYLGYVYTRETEEVLFVSHVKTISALYNPNKNKNLDDDADDDDDKEEENNLYFKSSDLRGKEKLEEINDVIRSLPEYCYWKINYFRILLNGINVVTVKAIIEKSIISSIERYLRPENEEDRNELELALSLSNVFYKLMLIIEKTYEFQKINNKWDPLADASLKEAQEDALMQLLLTDIPFNLKNFTLPDILDISRTLFEPVQTKLIDLYNCLEIYKEFMSARSLRRLQDYILETMLGYVEDREVSIKVLEDFIQKCFKRCKDEIGSSEKKIAYLRNKSVQSLTESPEKSKKIRPVSDAGEESSSMSNFDWVNLAPNIKSSGGVVNPGHSAKTLRSLMPKQRGGRLRIQRSPRADRPRGPQIASGSTKLQHGMKHLRI